jgi:hypothetical protein
VANPIEYVWINLVNGNRYIFDAIKVEPCLPDGYPAGQRAIANVIGIY